jgi:hypothetical protein
VSMARSFVVVGLLRFLGNLGNGWMVVAPILSGERA